MNLVAARAKIAALRNQLEVRATQVAASNVVDGGNVDSVELMVWLCGQ